MKQQMWIIEIIKLNLYFRLLYRSSHHDDNLGVPYSRPQHFTETLSSHHFSSKLLQSNTSSPVTPHSGRNSRRESDDLMEFLNSSETITPKKKILKVVLKLH